MLGDHDGGNPHRDILHYAGQVDISKYWIFAIVRNPWDRMVSEYHYQCQRADGKRTRLSFLQYLKMAHCKQVCSQAHWLRINNVNQCNFIGRFEYLQDSIEYVRKRLHIKEKMPHLNKSKHDDYRIYYNDKTAALVAKKHALDIVKFGYTF
jgi:hypothetical protein